MADGQHDDLATRIEGLAPRVEVLPDRLLLYTDDADSTIEQIHRAGVHVDSCLARRSTLEDVFLRLTGRTLDDG